jgi:hypothetical protein
MIINNNFNSSDRAFDIIVDHVANANNACKDLDIKKLQNYLKKHNGGSAEDYIKKNSHSFSLLLTKNDFDRKDIMNALLVCHNQFHYGFGIDVTKTSNNTFNKISTGKYRENKYNGSGVTANIFALSMRDTFKDIISKIKPPTKKFHTKYKTITYTQIDPKETSGQLRDTSSSKFSFSNVSVNGKYYLLITCYVENAVGLNQLTTVINNREVISTKYPFVLSNYNNTENEETVYKISIPILPEHSSNAIAAYVYTLQINCKFTEFELDNINLNDNINNDIQRAQSYFFNTHFGFDTTWSKIIIPAMTKERPYEVASYNASSMTQSLFEQRVTFSLYTPDADEKGYIYMKVKLLPKTYLMGTFEIVFGDIFPQKLTNFFDNFALTFSLA